MATLDQLKRGECRVRDLAMSLLRKLAWFPEHFRRSALALGRFVQAELTEPERNHNTAYLEELFWLGPSGTGADAKERLALVEALVSAPDGPTNESGMIALRGMLKAGDFTSGDDFSFGGWAFDFGWEPKTIADYQDWYGGALEIAKGLALSDSTLRAAARQAIAEHFRGLWRHGPICDQLDFNQLEAAALAIGTQAHWPEGWMAVRETIGLDAQRMKAGLVACLQVLKKRLAPVALFERLRTDVFDPRLQDCSACSLGGRRGGRLLPASVSGGDR
jgi:hypothetical protein